MIAAETLTLIATPRYSHLPGSSIAATITQTMIARG
jgi:hypothetical protein